MMLGLLLALMAPLSAAERTPDEARAIEVFEQSAPSAVFITQARAVRRPFRRQVAMVPAGSGSGFVWDAQGHIVTNFHVVDGGDAFLVMLYDTTWREAKLVGVDPATDLAVLRLLGPAKELRPVPLPPVETAPLVGQNTYAIGNPYGLEHTLTTGTVSAVGREIAGYGGVSIRGMVQTDAAINSGNSGGPLLDSSGMLLGVNTMIYSASGASSGLGFAVPVGTVRRVVPQLIDHGRVLRLDVGWALLPASVSRRAGIDGVIIERVATGSAAASVGLQGLIVERGRVRIGDVVVAIDGAPVRTPNEVFHALDRSSGEALEVTLLRDGVQRVVVIELPAEAGAPAAPRP